MYIYIYVDIPFLTSLEKTDLDLVKKISIFIYTYIYTYIYIYIYVDTFFD
jgi:hypothetical protein